MVDFCDGRLVVVSNLCTGDRGRTSNPRRQGEKGGISSRYLNSLEHGQLFCWGFKNAVWLAGRSVGLPEILLIGGDHFVHRDRNTVGYVGTFCMCRQNCCWERGHILD